jgi:alkane 1-monooxygenase
LGACGINVAHELGHRKSKFYQFCAKLLLLPNHYLHFFIEHNRGHHKNIATDKDPASAKLNESLYQFWVRSSIFSYLHAWKLEDKRLNQKWFSLQNEMIQYTIVTVLYISFLWVYLPNNLAIIIMLMGVVGFLLLETINYIEHYGLRRKIMPNGRYERVKPIHSWNSNHYLGRIMLYELTRHSDHHYLANKEYQILEHHENSPQLPLGYPTSMLLALLPPLWFKVINPRIPSQ